jgi:lysozyme family protein
MATSFRCAAVGCYSYQDRGTHALFQELQSYLNRFSRAVGFSPIGVDGVIGAGTVSAARRVAQAMASSGAGPQIVGMATPMIGVASTAENLARAAEPFVAVLKVAAQAAQLPAVAAPSQPPATAGGQNVAISAMPGFEPPSKLNKVYVAAGVVFGFAILFGGYQLVKDRL